MEIPQLDAASDPIDPLHLLPSLLVRAIPTYRN
jgi:hypothetical protein